MKNAPEKFETLRLNAIRLGEDDLERLYQMDGNRKLAATLGGVKSEEESLKYLHRNLSHWDENGYGLWMFYEKESGSFIGRGGLRNVEIEGNPEIEVVYALLPEFWGKGIATEIAVELTHIAAELLNLSELVAFTLVTNVASQRVMQKVGFIYERDFTYKELPHVLYRLKLKEEKIVGA